MKKTTDRVRVITELRTMASLCIKVVLYWSLGAFCAAIWFILTSSPVQALGCFVTIPIVAIIAANLIATRARRVGKAEGRPASQVMEDLTKWSRKQ